jgi:hypothetical protein
VIENYSSLSYRSILYAGRASATPLEAAPLIPSKFPYPDACKFLL